MADSNPSNVYLRHAIAGGMCASWSRTILVPIDVVKTRLQISNGEFKGMNDAFVRIYNREGMRGLWTGLGATSIGYSIQGACKFGLFEVFKDISKHAFGEETSRKHSLAIYMAGSAAAETISSICLCPWEAIRIRTVAKPDFAPNFVVGFMKIAREEGLNGFYKGLGPILGKQLPYTITQLTVFSKCVDLIYGTILPRYNISKSDLSVASQLGISIGCGVIAGVTSSIASHPADTLLSKINAVHKQNIAHSTMKQETSNWKLVVSITKELGFKGLWLGVGPRCLMVGVLSAGMFFVYDSAKVALGLPTSSGLASKK